MLDPRSSTPLLSHSELQGFLGRLTMYGDVTFTASEARKILTDLRNTQEALERQAAMTRELLGYMDRALRAEGLLRRVVPMLGADVRPEVVALLGEVGSALNAHP